MSLSTASTSVGSVNSDTIYSASGASDSSAAAAVAASAAASAAAAAFACAFLESLVFFSATGAPVRAISMR